MNKNVYIIPTNKPSRIVSEMGFITFLKNSTKGDLDIHPYHICITSDEKIIKEGDWRLDIRNDNIK